MFGAGITLPCFAFRSTVVGAPSAADFSFSSICLRTAGALLTRMVESACFRFFCCLLFFSGVIGLWLLTDAEAMLGFVSA